MLEYWFLFPVGIAIGALAMSAGVAGSNFWIPVYLLWLGLEPRLAFWVSLLTMLFGFGSGVVGNLRAGTIEWHLAGRYLWVAAPAAVAGAIASTRVSASWLLVAFAAFVLSYGSVMVWSFLRGAPENLAPDTPREQIAWTVGGVAGFLQGAIATGSGTLLMPAILGHRRIRHHAEAVGSSVLLVFVLSLLAMVFRIDEPLLGTLREEAGDMVRILAFAGPGAAVGGQLGPWIARRLPRRYLRVYVGALLILVGLLVGLRALAAAG